MVEWKEYRIKDLGEVVTGNTPPTSNREYYGTEYKFIKPTDMVEGQRFVSTTEEYYSELAYQKYKKCLLPPKTPCVVTIGSLGKKMCLTDTECFTNQAVNAVIPNKENDGEFLYYAFKASVLAYVKQLDSGTTSGRENVSKSSFSKIKVRVPPLPTQQKIASILSAYDNLIQNYKKQIEALQTAASELYKEWFVRFRFPGYQTTNFENGIPEGWKVYLIKDLCYINKKTVSSKDAKKEILYLDTGSITENVIDSFESYILEEAPSRARRIVKKNSIIFSTVRPNQNHYGILKTVPENLIVSTGFAVFDPKFDIANILYFFLSSKDFVDYCQMIAEGAVATYPSIKPEEIGKVKILLPTMDLAIKLNHSFESLFLRIENLKQQITNLTQQRDLLLPRLMSGKLEVE